MSNPIIIHIARYLLISINAYIFRAIQMIESVLLTTSQQTNRNPFPHQGNKIFSKQFNGSLPKYWIVPGNNINSSQLGNMFAILKSI